MSGTATRSKSGQTLSYQVLLLFLMMWELFVEWVQTAVHPPYLLTRQASFLLDHFSLLALWDSTAVSYAAYPLSCCLLE